MGISTRNGVTEHMRTIADKNSQAMFEQCCGSYLEHFKMKVEDASVFVGFKVRWSSPYFHISAASCNDGGFTRPWFVHANSASGQRRLTANIASQVVAVVDRHLVVPVAADDATMHAEVFASFMEFQNLGYSYGVLSRALAAVSCAHPYLRLRGSIPDR